MRELRGGTAIVTGASRGIGAAIARALAAAGMHLVLAARSEPTIEMLAAELRQRDVRVHVVPTDVSRDHDRRALIEAAVRELGALDVLVNNAGIGHVAEYHRMQSEDILRVMEVNLLAPMLLTYLALPPMLARGRGHIVNIASLAAKSFPPYNGPYVASKAGLIAFTKAIRLEYRTRGVSASAIIPGLVRDAGMFADQQRESPIRVPWLVGTTTPDAVAGAVVRAIRRDTVETVVNPTPLRPLMALGELFPALPLALTGRLGAPMYATIARARDGRRQRPR
jgi:short-subunit dehydrogenase